MEDHRGRRRCRGKRRGTTFPCGRMFLGGEERRTSPTTAVGQRNSRIQAVGMMGVAVLGSSSPGWRGRPAEIPRLQANSEAGWRAQEKQMRGSPEESQHIGHLKSGRVGYYKQRLLACHVGLPLRMGTRQSESPPYILFCPRQPDSPPLLFVLYPRRPKHSNCIFQLRLKPYGCSFQKRENYMTKNI